MPQKRDFISIMDWSSEELINNLELALELKKKTREGPVSYTHLRAHETR